MREPDPEVRQEAVVTAALQDASVIPQVARIAQGVDPKTGVADSGVVAEAFEFLGDFRTPTSARPLAPLLKAPSWKVRERAAYALRAIGDRRSVPALLDDLGDPNPDALYMVTTALNEATGDDSGLPRHGAVPPGPDGVRGPLAAVGVGPCVGGAGAAAAVGEWFRYDALRRGNLKMGSAEIGKLEREGKAMTYEYQVQAEGGSSFDNLERIGSHLQEMLNGQDAASLVAEGWELWQVNTLNDHQGVNGLILVYRRPKG